jgi:hypothetical protein
LFVHRCSLLLFLVVALPVGDVALRLPVLHAVNIVVVVVIRCVIDDCSRDYYAFVVVVVYTYSCYVLLIDSFY